MDEYDKLLQEIGETNEHLTQVKINMMSLKRSISNSEQKKIVDSVASMKNKARNLVAKTGKMGGHYKGKKIVWGKPE